MSKFLASVDQITPELRRLDAVVEKSLAALAACDVDAFEELTRNEETIVVELASAKSLLQSETARDAHSECLAQWLELCESIARRNRIRASLLARSGRWVNALRNTHERAAGCGGDAGTYSVAGGSHV